MIHIVGDGEFGLLGLQNNGSAILTNLRVIMRMTATIRCGSKNVESSEWSIDKFVHEWDRTEWLT